MKGISLRDAEKARLEITQQQALEIQKLYKDVYKEYRKQLKGMTSGGATASLRKSQLRHLTNSLKEAYNHLGAQLEGNITSAATQASQAVVEANSNWLSSIGLSLKGTYAAVPQDVVALLASGKLYGHGWTLSKAIWGESQQKTHDIETIVARGVAANKSSFDIAKDLEKYVNPGAAKPWDWSKVYPGVHKKVDYSAQRLARTMVSHAYQQSLERVCSKNPFVIGYRWRSAHVARTCELCIERSETDHHGMGPGVYPKGELPLDHPNGMCTFLTVMSDNLEGISNRLADWANGKADPELDGWAKGMFPSAKSQDPLSKEWLEKAGYSTDNLPENFKAWATKLDFDQQTEFLKLAGEGWSHPHPYQVMEAYYNEHVIPGGKSAIKKVKEEVVKKKVKEKVKKAAPKMSFDMDKIKQSIDDALSKQDIDYLQRLESDAAPWWNSLTKGEQKGIQSYTGVNYSYMNLALRDRNLDQLSSSVKKDLLNAVSGLKKYQTKEDLVVRRGSSLRSVFSMLGIEQDKDHDLSWLLANADKLQGSVAKDPGFLSTFPYSSGGFNRQVEFRIAIPKGSPAPYIDQYSKHRGEKELLLPPGSMHRLVGMEEAGTKLRVYLEFIGLEE